jgi:RNA polymerase sigma-70 factor (ECF subfamily)
VDELSERGLMPVSGENDAFFREVTAGMADGNEFAYRRFYDACFDKLYRHLLVRTRGDEHLARELGQLVLLRVVRYIQPFTAERVFWAWLYQLCRSAQVDWLRRNGRTVPEDFLEIWQEQTASDNADEELFAHLEISLETLEPAERDLLRMAYFEEVPQRAIADQLQSTPKAVESKLARIRKKLRHIILERLKDYVVF